MLSLGHKYEAKMDTHSRLILLINLGTRTMSAGQNSSCQSDGNTSGHWESCSAHLCSCYVSVLQFLSFEYYTGTLATISGKESWQSWVYSHQNFRLRCMDCYLRLTGPPLTMSVAGRTEDAWVKALTSAASKQTGYWIWVEHNTSAAGPRRKCEINFHPA